MSADRSICFCGVRYSISPSESISVEDRSHPLIVLARKHGLHHYFGDFEAPKRKYSLFLGRKLAILGKENSSGLTLQLTELQQAFHDVEEKLRNAGIEAPPSLFFEFERDA